ncbi:MAG: SEL1-like repeat protein [Gammaproteobacteria bacterium]|nr:SEL1-like repeat protein [Gammaproteobacteria bacterium]
MSRFFSSTALLILLFSGSATADYAKWKVLAEQGNAEAQYNLGLIYLHGIEKKQDYAIGKKWLTLAAEQLYPESLFDLGSMYFSGTYGVTQDYVLAHMWWNLAASQGEEAAGFLRDRLEKQRMTISQVEKAQRLASEFTQKFSNLGYVGNYQEGVGAAKRGDYKSAYKVWKPIAESGDSRAQLHLGQMYLSGKGVTQDNQTALKWFGLAAEQGHPKAQYNLALMHAKGQGVTKSRKNAAKWYKLAAQQGEVRSQINLGVMHQNGDGVPQNSEIAAKWYKRAAEQGHPLAQVNLALMYASGSGVAQDPNRAYMWLIVASWQGDTEATKVLKKIRGKMPSTQEAIESEKKSKQLARDCVAKSYKDC